MDIDDSNLLEREEFTKLADELGVALTTREEDRIWMQLDAKCVRQRAISQSAACFVP